MVPGLLHESPLQATFTNCLQQSQALLYSNFEDLGEIGPSRVSGLCPTRRTVSGARNRKYWFVPCSDGALLQMEEVQDHRQPKIRVAL